MNSFFFFIIILFVLAVTLRVDFVFSILYLFAGIYIVLRLWTDHVFSRLEVRRTFVERAFLGDLVTVKLKLTNHSPLPILWLQLNEVIPWSLSMSTAQAVREIITLKGKESRTITYTLRASRRGYYAVGPLTLTGGDLLGATPGHPTQLEAAPLIVYPQVIRMVTLKLPTHSPQAILPVAMPVFEDPARITGLKSYQWGDNPRHIHWPATASSGQVMVKQFQPAIARECTLFLSLSRSDYHRRQREHALELAITVAASLANHMLSQEKLPVGLDTIALDPLTGAEQHFSLPAGKDQSQLMRILEVLARIQPVDEADFLANLRRQVVNQPWGATVVIITGQESKALAETLLWLKSIGFSPVLVLAGQKTGPFTVPRLGLPAFDIWDEKDIERWLPTL